MSHFYRQQSLFRSRISALTSSPTTSTIKGCKRQGYGCCWMSTTTAAAASASVAARDTRMGGRQRFYINVDVAPCPPVWESDNDADKTNDNKKIQSPISAGVDGTDSASGVVGTLSQHNNLDTRRQLLQPRKPGTMFSDATTTTTGTTKLSSSSSSCSWYCIRLDERPLRTPLGQTLAVPSETLAHAVAAEWNCQVTGKIRPTQMPLMTLTATALDQTSQAADHYREQTLRFLQTDTVCYYADPVEDRALYRRQEAAWKDLHAWIEQWSGGYAPAVVIGHMEGVLLAKNNKNRLPHAPELVAAAANFCQSLDAWHLTALHSMAAESKSFWIALALLLNHHQQQYATSKDGSSEWTMDVKEAMEAARAEEEFNISNWGLVEGGHDYDRLNCSVQLHAAVVLKDCLALDAIDDR